MSFFEELNQYYLRQPHEVSIETLALCNARCTFCPYPTLDRIGTRMPDELLDRLIDEMAAFQQPVYFSPFKVNEPFLDERLIPLCEKFLEKSPLSVVRLFTNGQPLTDAKLDGVARLKRVAHLWVSLNSHDPDEYERVMGIKFALTVKRLDRLHERDFPHPVVVSGVGVGQDFIDYVQDRWPKFRVAAIKKDAWIDFTTADNSIVPNVPCGRWWELNIMATGKVALCCMDGTGEYAIGDINTQTMLEVYNAPALLRRRERIMTRKTESPCNRCTY